MTHEQCTFWLSYFFSSPNPLKLAKKDRDQRIPHKNEKKYLERHVAFAVIWTKIWTFEFYIQFNSNIPHNYSLEKYYVVSIVVESELQIKNCLESVRQDGCERCIWRRPHKTLIYSPYLIFCARCRKFTESIFVF